MAEQIKSFFVPSALTELQQAEKSLQTIQDEVTALAGKPIKLEFDLKGAGSLKDLVALSNELKKVNKELADATLKLAKAQDIQAAAALKEAKAEEEKSKARLNDAKAQDVQNRTKERGNKASEQESKNNKKLLTDYEILAKAYIEARDKYRAYALVLGQSHPLTLQAAADANKMNDTLKKLGAATGEFNRNVGNYNAVGVEFNRLLQEAPAFATGFKTGILGLSNNIPMFTQAVQAARKEGKSWGEILKNLTSQLTSPLGLITIGVTVLTLWGDKLFATSKATSDAEKANKKYADSLKSIEENAMSSTYEEISRLKVLTSVATDETATREKRNQAVDKLQKMYPSYLGNIDDETIKSGQAEQAIKNLTDALLQKAVAEAASQKYAAAYLRQAELAKANEKAVRDLVDARNALAEAEKQGTSFVETETGVSKIDAAKSVLARAEANREAVAAQYDAAIREANDYQNTAEEAFKKMPSLFDKPTRTRAAEDTVNAELSLQDRLNKALAEKRKIDLEDSVNKSESILNDEKQILDNRLNALIEFYESKRAINNIDKNAELSTIQFKLDKIAEIENKSEKKRSKQEKSLVRSKEVLEAEKDAIIAKYTIKENQIVLDAVNKKNEIIRNGYDIETKYRIDSLSKIEENQTVFYQKELSALVNSYSKGELTTQQFNQRRQILNARYNKEILAQQIEFVEEAIKEMQALGLPVEDLINKLTQLKIKFNEAFEPKGRDGFISDKDLESIKQVIQFTNLLTSALQELGSINDAYIKSLDYQIQAQETLKEKEIDRVQKSTLGEKEKQAEIDLINANAEQKREEFEAKKRKAEIENAKFQKAANIAQIIQNTAAAITGALKVPVIGGALAAGYGALGALQLAKAIATPIPQFYKGTDNSPEGFAFTGERGRELKITPSGDVSLTPSTTTLDYLEKGTKIIPHNETEQILRSMQYATLNGYVSTEKKNRDNKLLAKTIQEGNKDIVKAIDRNGKRKNTIPVPDYRWASYYKSTFKA